MSSELAGVCTCPYFLERGQPCKHLWATLLAAEKLGHLSEAATKDNLGFDTETLLDEAAYMEYTEGEGEEDEFEDAEEDAYRTSATPIVGASTITSPQASRPGAWKAHLDQIGKDTTASKVPPWPMESEICYVLDITKSQIAGCLVVTTEKMAHGRVIPGHA